MGRTAARFALSDRLAGTWRSKRRAAACTPPFSRPGSPKTNGASVSACWTGLLGSRNASAGHLGTAPPPYAQCAEHRQHEPERDEPPGAVLHRIALVATAADGHGDHLTVPQLGRHRLPR